jgi:dolichol kinase
MTRLKLTKNDSGRSISQDLLEQHSPTLSRTPRPYHLRGNSLTQSQPWDLRSEVQSNSAPNDNVRKISRTESSESGTEADDEKGPLLKGLPAPTPRSHKGLRGTTPSNLTPFASPLPTPPAFLDAQEPEFFRLIPKKIKKTQHVEKHTRDWQAYYERRWREIIRRVTESLLLLGIGILVWNSQGGLDGTRRWIDEIVTFLAISPLLYLLYPLGRGIRARRTGKSRFQAVRLGFHIPSRFDPGPLLYPVFLPFMVALSLFGRSPAFLPAAIVCGISSIPPTISSRSTTPVLPGHLHWLMSVLPLHVWKYRFVPGSIGQPLSLKVGPAPRINTEDLALVFPIHQALVTVLAYLTTTSLDFAELQLLSSALINLYIFASTPQTQILKALMWLGGMCLLATCKDLMTWEVALARVPSWKLLRPRRHRTLSSKIDQAICTLLVRGRTSKVTRDESSSEDDNQRSAIAKLRPSLKLQLNARGFSSSVPSQEPQSALEAPLTRTISEILVPSHRRNTFTAFGDNQASSKSTPKRTKSVHIGSTGPFLAFSIEQAIVRKWAYALIIYALVVAIILGPIRLYVANMALNGHEPVGWALAYLFGNIPAGRALVNGNNLKDWIVLPNQESPSRGPFTTDGIGYYRQHVLGAANTRLLICGYCLAVLGTGIAAVLRLTSIVEVDTRRKVFHGIMVAMLLPTIFVDPCFIALALALILAIFLLLDLFRASQMPPISKPLTSFLAPYVDGRDHRGPVIVSHIFLLIGCAIPLWLSLAAAPRTGDDPWTGWDTSVRDLSMVSGVICVGMGDAAASLIGRRYGRTKWYWAGGKSLEGSLAFAVAVTCGLLASWLWLRLGGWLQWDAISQLPLVLGKCFLAGSGASMIEATLTAGNDNVIVPVGLFLLVRGFKI